MKKLTVLAVAAALATALTTAYLAPWQEETATGKSGKAGKSKVLGRKPGQPKPYHGDLPSLADINIRNAVLDKVYSGLDYPWAMEFVSDSELLITEFGGKLKILDTAGGTVRDITGLPDYIATGKGQIGLMDVALHPEFNRNGVIYFSHAVANEEKPAGFTTAVSRAVLRGGELSEVRQIFVATPYAPSNSNFGGALAFDDQGFLYIGTGDRSLDLRAQKPDQLNGKIIRLTDNGEVPQDNPFVDDPRVDDRIYALGVRNPQGLVFDPETGNLYETEHGPMGGDEVNRIEAGRNYGWPTISYGANYNTQKKGLGTALDGLEQPLFYYLPSIATSPLELYRGTMFPEWRGDLLVGALKAAHINKLDLVDGRVISEQRILREFKGRVRDIKVAADGSVWFLLQNGGRVYRLHRDFSRKDLEQPAQRRGATVYQAVCASCHSSGLEGIPQLDDPDAWVERERKGRKQLYQNTLDGIGGMPPRGLCDNCSAAELRAAVDYMLKTATGKVKAARASPPAPPPNFVILIADDLGWNDLGAYGNRVVHTPHIDRLAANGLRFDNAFLTTSSCSASRASILTGKYPHSNGLLHLHQDLPGDQNTLGRLLAAGGYYTAAIGKWHIGSEVRDQFGTIIENRSESGTGNWIPGLRQRPADTPFFFWLASRDPHRPHKPTAASLDLEYDPAEIDIPIGFVDGELTRAELADYYREVSRFDRDVGEVLAELQTQGVAANTVVIVMSDNGRPFQMAKTTLYDDGIKTPFIVHWPRVIADPGVRGQLVSMVDLAPTLLEWAQLPRPADMQGVSFAGMLTSPDLQTRQYIFAERNWHGVDAHERLVRSLQFAYKENQYPLHGPCLDSGFSGSRSFQDFEAAYRRGLLSAADAECFATVRARTELMAVDATGTASKINLAGNPRFADVEQSMRGLLAQWRRETRDRDFIPYLPAGPIAPGS